MIGRDAITKRRLRLLNQGYVVVPSKAKEPIRTWKIVRADETMIRRWGRSVGIDTTGTRLERGLGMIDIDIKDPVAVAAISASLLEVVPALTQPEKQLLVRYGGDAKEAWPVQVKEPFGVVWSRRWAPPNAAADDKGQRVEVFGGKFAKFFALFGPHSYDEHTGEVLREYRWRDRSLLEVPVFDLPSISEQDAYLIVDTAEAALRRLGWQALTGTRTGASAGGWQHNLSGDEIFQCDDGVSRSFDECCVLVAAGQEVRCSASFIDPDAENRTRCRFGRTKDGKCFVIDHDTYLKHALKLIELDPKDVAERLRRMTGGGNG